MKKFLRSNLILIFSLLAVLTACDKKETLDEETDDLLFYDVVYQAVATRETPQHQFVGVEGIQQMKVSQDTETAGTFIIFYRSYKEPQFVFSTCSGGFKGNFSLSEDTSTDDSDDDYNVMDPYEPELEPNDTGTDTEDETEVAQIQNYKFNLSITQRSLEPQCRPESNRIIAVYRFTNGQIIVKSEYREILMRPVLTTESQIE